jgi:hypothetical protein
LIGAAVFSVSVFIIGLFQIFPDGINLGPRKAATVSTPVMAELPVAAITPTATTFTVAEVGTRPTQGSFVFLVLNSLDQSPYWFSFPNELGNEPYWDQLPAPLEYYCPAEELSGSFHKAEPM